MYLVPQLIEVQVLGQPACSALIAQVRAGGMINEQQVCSN